MKNKPRLYFDCPIKALYMGKEFGVIMLAGDQGHYGYKDCLPYTLEHFEKHGKFYVSPKSEAIFEPQLFDRGYNEEHYAITVRESIDDSGKLAWVGYAAHYGIYKDDEVKIIMRDSKQFFMPEVENA